MSKERLNFVSYVVYFFLVIAWWLLIFNYVLKNTRQLQRLEAEQQRLDTIAQRPITDYVNYIWVYPQKQTFDLWEIPKLRSERIVNEVDGKVYPIRWHDIMYCDVYDWEWYWRTRHEYERYQWTPVTGHITTPPREWNSWTPENPIGNYIPARCKILAEIKVCPEPNNKNYCKTQYIRSEEFYIWEESGDTQAWITRKASKYWKYCYASWHERKSITNLMEFTTLEACESYVAMNS